MTRNYDNQGRDQINIERFEGDFYLQNIQPGQRREASQEKLLKVVEKEVNDRIAQSLHLAVGKMLINLGKEMQPERVRSPWDREISIGQRSPQPLAADTTILQVFERDDVQRKLLILGEPGSGKTTTMLELARDLLSRAKQDVHQPTPVLLNLSSWQDPKQPILDWLTTELKAKYGVRQDLGRTWLAHNQLLPILDGLDEVEPLHQEACTVALNQWLKDDVEHLPVGVVVCCRHKEYEEIARRRLFLNGAVFLQSLSEVQIEQYFAQFELATVWESARSSETLKGLLSKPLFLSIFGLVATAGKFDVADWHQQITDADQQEYIFNCYCEAMMSRELTVASEQELGILSRTYGRKPLPNPDLVQRTLVFAAKVLEQNSQTEFLIERLQPNCLPEEWQREEYKTLFILLIASIIITSQIIASRFSIWLPILVSTFPWLKYSLTANHIYPMEKLYLNWRKALPSSLSFRIGTLIFASIIWGASQTDQELGYFAVVILTGIAVNKFVARLAEEMHAEIEIPLEPNQGIKNTYINMFRFTCISLPLFLVVGLIYQFRINLFAHLEFSPYFFVTFGIYIVGICFFEGGGKALLQHVALRLVLKQSSYAPFRYDHLLNYCTERLLLQRIGGRYRFMHKLLQEHFAKMELD